METTHIWLWLATALGLFGTVLNVKMNRYGFLIWIVSNAMFTIINFIMGIYPTAFLFGVYFVLAVWGWVSWGKDKKKPVEVEVEA